MRHRGNQGRTSSSEWALISPMQNTGVSTSFLGFPGRVSTQLTLGEETKEGRVSTGKRENTTNCYWKKNSCSLPANVLTLDWREQTSLLLLLNSQCAHSGPEWNTVKSRHGVMVGRRKKIPYGKNSVMVKWGFCSSYSRKVKFLTVF